MWLPAEVMKKNEYLRLITALSVGLSFLAIIILSHWSSTFMFLGVDGNYTGKKTLHLLGSTQKVFDWGGGGVHVWEFYLISLK